MAYHPVPMATINKLTHALKVIAGMKTATTFEGAKSNAMLAKMIASETLDETAPEIHSIKTGEPLVVPAI